MSTTPKPNQEDILEILKDCLETLDAAPKSELTAETRLQEDLGLDSLDMVELVSEFEERISSLLDEKQLGYSADLTLGELANRIHEILNTENA